jgi:hypothetical protein
VLVAPKKKTDMSELQDMPETEAIGTVLTIDGGFTAQ